MKRTVFMLAFFGVLHFLPKPCRAGGSSNDSRAFPWHSSHTATHDEEESQKTSSHPNDQKTSVPLSQHDQSKGDTAARQKAKDTEHAGPVLSPVKDIHREEQALDHRLKNDDNETAPIRSYPSNGRTKTKKTMVFVNEADGRSKPKKTMTFWNEADGRSKPKKTMAFWNEADGRSKPKKTMTFWNEADVSSKPKTTIAVWDQTEGRWKEDVSPSLKKTQVESGTLSRRPQKGSIKEALEQGSNKEDPGKGYITEAPRKGYIIEAPRKGYITEAPRKGYITEALRKGSVKEAPEKGFIKKTPRKGYIKEAQEKGSIKEVPEKGLIKEIPEKGFIKKAPEKGFIKEAPEKGSMKKEPTKGSIKETQEGHILKDRNENQTVLSDLQTDLGETHTAPKLPQKRQNEGGIVQHARKGQNQHEAVSASSTKERFSECNGTGRREVV